MRTSDGELPADTVVVATGTYRKPYRPAGAATVPADIAQLDVDTYRNPSALPAGKILIVGSGQSGCQVAEELNEAGRDVFLSCGRAPGLTRRIGDRDIVWWAAETGFLDHTVESLPSPMARLEANILATGHGGGHDLNFRTLRRDEVTLLGRFLGVDGRTARFAPDLDESVAWGDERYDRFMGLVRKLVDERGLPEPDMAPLEPFDPTSPSRSTSWGSGRCCSRVDSVPTSLGCTCREGSTRWDSPCRSMGRARRRRACTSPVCTGSGSGSPRSSTASARTPRSWQAGSPGRARNGATSRPQCVANRMAGSLATQLVSGTEAGSSIQALRMSM